MMEINQLFMQITQLRIDCLTNLKTCRDTSLEKFIHGQLAGLNQVEHILLINKAAEEYQQATRAIGFSGG